MQNSNYPPTHIFRADAIHYIVMGMGIFARQFNLTKREACNYLSRFKGLEFTINNYEAEHQLSLQDCVDDMRPSAKETVEKRTHKTLRA